MFSGVRDRITLEVSPSPNGKVIESLRTPASIP
jgi:hypothetical protein